MAATKPSRVDERRQGITATMQESQDRMRIPQKGMTAFAQDTQDRLTALEEWRDECVLAGDDCAPELDDSRLVSMERKVQYVEHIVETMERSTRAYVTVRSIVPSRPRTLSRAQLFGTRKLPRTRCTAETRSPSPQPWSRRSTSALAPNAMKKEA